MTENKLRRLLSDLGVEVVGKNGKWLTAHCVFAEDYHEFGTDTKPSFGVCVDDEGYSAFKCFTCHNKGGLVSLIHRLGNVRGEDYSKLVMRVLMDETPDRFRDFDEAREVEPTQKINPIEASIYLRMYPLAGDVDEARNYLISRGVSKTAASALDLHYDPNEKRILFPVYGCDKELYGFSGRSILNSEDYPYTRYPKVKDYAGLHKDSLILGANLIDNNNPLLVVEGLFALAHMYSICANIFCNPVATLGSHLSRKQRDILVSFTRPIYMLYDNDFAGDQGLWGPVEKGLHVGGGAVDMLKDHVPTFVCKYPDEIYDPDDLSRDQVCEMIDKNYEEA